MSDDPAPIEPDDLPDRDDERDWGEDWEPWEDER